MSSKIRQNKDFVQCCLKLNDTEFTILIKIVEGNKSLTSEELSKDLGLSKTSVENSLKKLIELGLVNRLKYVEKKVGRPKYFYKPSEDCLERIKVELVNCANKILTASQF